jgi:NhaP-type Na+/H+ or K+/H+ antiporter
MLMGGFAAMNLAYEIVGNMDKEVTLIVQQLALIVILTRAGLGLDLVELKSKSASVLLLTAMPQIVESAVCAAFIIVLFDMPWALAFAAGNMMGAVTPAVVVPACIRLQNMGYGVAKGINQIIIAAASLDDILAISMFGIFLGIGMSGAGGHGVFGDNQLVNSIVTGPFELVGGLILGVLLGLVLRIDFFKNLHKRVKAAVML